MSRKIVGVLNANSSSQCKGQVKTAEHRVERSGQFFTPALILFFFVFETPNPIQLRHFTIALRRHFTMALRIKKKTDRNKEL